MILNYVKSRDPAGEAGPESDADDPAWAAYTRALQEAGVMVGGAALHPAGTATTVRLHGGRRDVQDGPYADTKEQLGGYYLVDVADLDAALEWAARNPAAAAGAVEVRPVARG